VQETLDLGTCAPGPGSAGSAGFSLRPYQLEALEAIRREIASGTMRTLVALPTGTGKTVVFAHLPEALGLGKKRLLVLAHREELLDQALAKFRVVNPDMRCAIEQADRYAGGAQVVIASVQTLRSVRLGGIDPDQFGAIVIDEAHHAIAKSYRAILNYFGCDQRQARIPVVGFTATPKRGDGVGLSKVFDSIAYDAPMLEMIDRGYLSRLAGVRLDTRANLDEVSIRAGDFVASQLSQAIDTSERNEMVVSGYLEHAGDRQKTLVFAVDVAHAEHLAFCFNRTGILRAAAVHGKMAKDDRRAVLAAFSAGDLDLVTNCMVLTEGFDEPGVDCIIMARPTKSGLLYTQMVGRGTRLAEGKKTCLVIDCTDNSARHDLVSISTLFGIPKRLNLQGQDAKVAAEQLEMASTRYPWLDLDKLRTLDELDVATTKIEFFAPAVPAELQSWTKFQWVKQAGGGYKLPLPKREGVVVEPTHLDTFKATGFRRIDADGQKLAWERFVVGEFATIRDAIRASDQVVRRTSGWNDATRLIDTRARWRDKPASEKQVALLARMKIAHPPEITKGQAATILTLAFNRGGRRR